VTPNKKIPSFYFKSQDEKNDDMIFFHGVDIDDTINRLLAEQLRNEIDTHILNTLGNELTELDPLNTPRNGLLYYNFPFEEIEDPVIYNDGSWSMANNFDGVIGIRSEIKPHTLI
jgi:hypothetical protein